MKSKPKKNIYLLLSVCYKKSERFQETQEIVHFSIFSSTSVSGTIPNTTRPTSIEAR